MRIYPIMFLPDKEIVEKYKFCNRKLSSLQTGGQVVCVKTW